MDNGRLAEFPPRTIDKVERLLDLLEEMGEHVLPRTDAERGYLERMLWAH